MSSVGVLRLVAGLLFLGFPRAATAQGYLLFAWDLDHRRSLSGTLRVEYVEPGMEQPQLVTQRHDAMFPDWMKVTAGGNAVLYATRPYSDGDRTQESPAVSTIRWISWNDICQVRSAKVEGSIWQGWIQASSDGMTCFVLNFRPNPAGASEAVYRAIDWDNEGVRASLPTPPDAIWSPGSAFGYGSGGAYFFVESADPATLKRTDQPGKTTSFPIPAIPEKYLTHPPIHGRIAANGRPDGDLIFRIRYERDGEIFNDFVYYRKVSNEWSALKSLAGDSKAYAVGEFFVVREAALHPESDIKKGLRYPAVPTGKYYLISKSEGLISELQLDAGSLVMHVDSAQVIVNEQRELIRYRWNDDLDIYERDTRLVADNGHRYEVVIPVDKMPEVAENAK